MSAGDELRKKAKRIQSAQERAVRSALRDYRKAVLQEARQDTGGDLELSGFRNGRKLTVTTSVKGKSGDVVGEIRGGPGRQRAPWFWLEFGTRSGSRPERRGSAGTYQHSGTRGKRTWSRRFGSMAALRADIARRIEREM